MMASLSQQTNPPHHLKILEKKEEVKSSSSTKSIVPPKPSKTPTIKEITKHKFTSFAQNYWPNKILFSPDTFNISSSHPIKEEEDGDLYSKFHKTNNEEIPIELYTFVLKYSELYNFDANIIQKIYQALVEDEYEASKIMILEFSQYFENFLWPFYHSSHSSKEYLLSIVILVNEKCRQQIPIWEAFLCQYSRPVDEAPPHLDITIQQLKQHAASTKADHSSLIVQHLESLPSSSTIQISANRPDDAFFITKFKRFFYNLLRLHTSNSISYKEKTFIVKFLIKCYQSLEQEMVRKVCLSVCGPAMWHHLHPSFRTTFLRNHPSAAVLWKRINKKFDLQRLSESKEESQPDDATLDVNYFKYFLSEFLDIIEDERSATADFSMDAVLYVERTVELLIDLLSQLPTRRMIRPLIMARQIVVRCKLSYSAQHSEGGLFRQLVDILKFYESFEINDETGLSLTHLEYTELHYDKVNEFQKLCYKEFKDDAVLFEASMLNISAIDSSNALEKLLDDLDIPKLFAISQKLHLLDTSDIIDMNGDGNEELKQTKKTKRWVKQFLKASLMHYLERKPDQLQRINETPLYPSEELIWDPNLVPAEHFKGDFSLALPKLNLQFLTIHDYLLRNFNLFRLESTYEIREDLEDAIFRMKCRVGDDGQSVFKGQSRMALPIHDVSVVLVQKPKVGSSVPAEVRAEISVNLKGLKPNVRAEWDKLRQFDVLFMCEIAPQFEEVDVRLSELTSVTDFPEKFGVISVRGCEVIEVLDEEGKAINDQNPSEYREPLGDARTVRVFLDTAQYQLDMNQMQEEGAEIYSTCNLLIRRKPKENNFKSILETIRNLMNNLEDAVIPNWLHDLFLGYGDPGSAQYFRLPTEIPSIDFLDTFLDREHLVESFPKANEIKFEDSAVLPPFKLTFCKSNDNMKSEHPNTSETIKVCTYKPLNMGPYPECKRRLNTVRFTATQVECIRAGTNAGLTMIVGPPGTGKTDTAVQIVNLLYHNFPEQRILLIAHSNQALNDLFEKIVKLDIDERYLLRLGIGEQELQLDNDFSKWGRVNYMLQRRMDLLGTVERLGGSLCAVGDVSFTCETALRFNYLHIISRIEQFNKYLKEVKANPESLSTILKRIYAYTEDGFYYFGKAQLDRSGVVLKSKDVEVMKDEEDEEDEEDDTEKSGVNTNEVLDDVKPHQVGVEDGSVVSILFPFKSFFEDATNMFTGEYDKDIEIAEGCFRYLSNIFKGVEECQAFELLRNSRDRGDYLLMKHAKIIAMTCTHAALTRQNLVEMKFKYDSLIMEEAAQVLEVETFIPMLLQQAEHGVSRLKRVVLIGDHHQLPPIVQNMAIQQYGHLDQSLFARFVRLKVPFVQLDYQGRARPQIADLYNWEYRMLGNLPVVTQSKPYLVANAGFAYEYQFIDVGDYQGVGESAPLPHFYQNLGEAEYAVALYMYMRIIGYPADRISIITTYNGQRALIEDIIQQRCSWNPAIGWPARVSTVDKYQGQQNDYIILSLVRTERVGHLRDIRRLIVAMSRARLGLYIFGRWSLFNNCFELAPVLNRLSSRPIQLAVTLNERHPTNREAGTIPPTHYIRDVNSMFQLVQQKASETVELIKKKRLMEQSNKSPMNGDLILNGTSDGGAPDLTAHNGVPPPPPTASPSSNNINNNIPPPPPPPESPSTKADEVREEESPTSGVTVDLKAEAEDDGGNVVPLDTSSTHSINQTTDSFVEDNTLTAVSSTVQTEENTTSGTEPPLAAPQHSDGDARHSPTTIASKQTAETESPSTVAVKPSRTSPRKRKQTEEAEDKSEIALPSKTEEAANEVKTRKRSSSRLQESAAEANASQVNEPKTKTARGTKSKSHR